MPTWIFLRGLTRERRHWGRFVGQFQQALPGHQVVTLDLAGNGLRNFETSAATVQAMVADCRAQLAQSHTAPPYHLLTMSLGAMVAVAWAQTYPKEIASQVLINTSLRPFSSMAQRLRPANYGTLLRLTLSGASPLDWERAILRMTSNQNDPSILPTWLAMRQANQVSRSNALRQLLAAVRFCAPPEHPLTPTLLLASEHDHLVSVECSRTLARHWQCALRTHPSAGHDLPLDDGPWVVTQVAQWLEPKQNFYMLSNM